MSPTFYYILHVFSVIVLSAYTFQAFVAPAEQRKKLLAFTGIASLVALISAFGLLHKLGHPMTATWVYLKFAAWLGLSALAGVGFRRRGAVGLLTVIALALVVLALYAVYVRPA